ncbi:MAG: YjiH family protein [Synergistaceae bacterium]|jgi:nucleoside recognition membrane protein YjiH|nr:YjiH family protein [Synergistaceae bacterium]
MSVNVNVNGNIKNVWRFIIPSTLGALLFMLPVPYGEGFSVPVALLVKAFNGLLGSALPVLALIVVVVSGVLTFATKIFKPSIIMSNRDVREFFDVPAIWAVLRVVGMVFAVMVFFQKGPEMVIADATGKFILYDLVAPIMAIVVFAGGLLPLLLEFGLLEFVGTYFSKVFRKLFTLPGRAAVDCVTSWLGDTTVAVMLTANQYEKGYYSEREAVVIVTTFSAVSIAFSLVVIEQVGLGHMFIPFYLTVIAVGIVCAVILPRIPPLSLRKSNHYTKADLSAEFIPAGYSTTQWAVKCAVDKANGGYTFRTFLRDSTKNLLQVIFSLSPVIMAIATLALIVSQYTHVLEWLGAPFTPLLTFLGLPEAEAASKTLVVGFTDMFIPSVIASSEITSQMTRFVVAVVSITQLIFLSENGAMMLGCKIPINIAEMFLIFLERTIISVIITTLIARFILQF